MMNKITKYPIALLAALLLLAAACSRDEGGEPAIPEGMVQVNFRAPGTYGAPFSDLKQTRGEADAQHEIPSKPDSDDGGQLVQYKPQPIEDGVTLWVIVYKDIKGTEEERTRPHGEIKAVKSYRISGKSLIPCKVDDDGKVTSEYDTPLYLPLGKYVFRALGPACKLVKDDDGHYALDIDNGEWVISNDERYEETAGDAFAELTSDKPDCLVTLKPLINQTARLKFTLYSASNDPFVHSLQLHPIGVELSGLQRHDVEHHTNGQGEPWNWKFCIPGDTLVARPGNKNVLMYLREPLASAEDYMVIETPILPTDAYATPIMALFNVRVNGNPTQFDMMLNRKVFRAGYSYHYRGRVYINNGVAAMDWQNVAWEVDIPFFEPQQPAY